MILYKASCNIIDKPVSAPDLENIYEVLQESECKELIYWLAESVNTVMCCLTIVSIRCQLELLVSVVEQANRLYPSSDGSANEVN